MEFITKQYTDTEAQYKKLLALSPVTEEAVNRILNSSWTRIECNQCKRSVEAAVVLDVTDGEYTTYICYDCLVQAVALFASVSPEETS